MISMPSLAETQRKFWSSLNHYSDDVLSEIYGDGIFASEQRMEVYRMTAISLRISVLKDVFPVCEKILGEKYFSQIAKFYFKDNPSINPDLNQYGESFPEFCDRLITERNELKDFAYIGDLARLEWRIQKAYFSKDNLEFDIKCFEKKCHKDAGSIILSLQPNVFILKSAFPVLKIWNAHQDVENLDQQHFLHDQENVCIYRDKYKVTAENIDQLTYCLLSAINEKKSLSEISALFENSEQLNPTLALSLQKGWLLV